MPFTEQIKDNFLKKSNMTRNKVYIYFLRIDSLKILRIYNIELYKKKLIKK